MSFVLQCKSPPASVDHHAECCEGVFRNGEACAPRYFLMKKAINELNFSSSRGSGHVFHDVWEGIAPSPQIILICSSQLLSGVSKKGARMAT